MSGNVLPAIARASALRRPSKRRAAAARLRAFLRSSPRRRAAMIARTMPPIATMVVSTSRGEAAGVFLERLVHGTGLL